MSKLFLLLKTSIDSTGRPVHSFKRDNTKALTNLLNDHELDIATKHMRVGDCYKLEREPEGYVSLVRWE